MKVIELGATPPTLEEVIGLAKRELVVLRRPDGEVFALSAVDDFAVEVELLRSNPEFLAYLRERSGEKPIMTLEELRQELAI